MPHLFNPTETRYICLISFADIFESLGNVILATDEEQIAATSSDTNTNTAASGTTTTASPGESQQPIESQVSNEEDIQEQRQQVICFSEDACEFTLQQETLQWFQALEVDLCFSIL